MDGPVDKIRRSYVDNFDDASLVALIWLPKMAEKSDIYTFFLVSG